MFKNRVSSNLFFRNKEYAVHKAAYQQQQNVPWINNPVEFPPLSQHQQQDIWGGIVDSQHYVQQSQQQAIQQNLNISSASSTLHPTSNSNYSQAQFQYFPMVYSQPVYSNAGIYDEEKAKLGFVLYFWLFSGWDLLRRNFYGIFSIRLN